MSESVRGGRLARLTLATAITALLAGFGLPATGALAASSPASPAGASKAPLADDIAAAQAKLASLDDSLDVADEGYRNGQIALHKAKLSQAGAERRLAAGRARRAALQNRVDQIAVLAYQTGGAPGLLLASPDSGNLAESTAVLSQFAADQANTLSAAAAAQYDLAVAQTAATQSATATARSAVQLAAAKAVIVGQVAQHKTIVSSLITRQHTLEAIAAEKARLAVIAAAKAAAEKQAAARKAAEAAAAAALAEAKKAAAAAAAAKAAAEHEAAQRAADQRRADSARAAALRKARAATSTSGSGETSAGPPSSRAATAVAAAYKQLGAPYDWAADGPATFDCSGLTAYAWAAAGITLPHSSQAQYDVGSHVPRSELAPGDLVFFGDPIHHVGIYVGNGEMIDAPQTGDVVRVQSINRSDYTGAVRVTG